MKTPWEGATGHEKHEDNGLEGGVVRAGRPTGLDLSVVDLGWVGVRLKQAAKVRSDLVRSRFRWFRQTSDAAFL